MLEFSSVLTTGGLLLFSSVLQTEQKIFLTLVNRIIDSKNLQSDFTIETLKINYLYDAVLGLVFVIAWRKEIVLDHPKKLLQLMSLAWKGIYNRIIWKDNLIVETPDFNAIWVDTFQKWMNYINRKDTQGTIITKFQQTQAGKKLQKKKDNKQKDDDKPKKIKQEIIQTLIQTSNPVNDQQQIKQQTQFDKLSPRQRILLIQSKKQTKSPKSPKQSPQKSQQQQINKNRKWEGGKISNKQLKQLDRSKIKSIQHKASNIYQKQQTVDNIGFIQSDQQQQQEQKQSMFLSKWVSKIKNIVGDKKITKEDLKEVLIDFKQKLMEKNVAHDVAQKVADAVGVTLLETKTKTFTSVHKTVKQAMKQALRKILTPKKKIDLIVQVTKERQKLKPYVIVFIGVNGVGKSTNLAKVAYKLKSAKLSVMLAACDNFRAGAVEQIMTHGRNLDIPVFQKGYKQEPANIAFEAIRDATKKRFDAVLIDTAGRMQDNQPLMKQLARLVKMNKPNLVVFIGQALVGNDAVDQITKFNKALLEQSTEANPTQIDAILLSKFDTVDDKVGTALSLVYSTSKPILFVGVGQNYPNLKELNVSTIVHALLS